MLRLCTLLTLMALLVACEPRRDDGEIWRFAIEETRGSVQDSYAQRFAELVHERTRGEVKVIVYPYGTLGTSDQVTEQLHDGTLQLAMSSPGHLGKIIPEVQALLLHYVLSGDEEVDSIALGDAELREMMGELYAERGLGFLAAFSEGEMVWTTREAIHTPEDFEGIRMRVMTSPLLLATYDAYGSSATPLPYAEVYSGLQLHMIDGQVNPIFAIEEMSFYEVTDHMTFPHHALFITTVAANRAFLDGLDAGRRQMLEGVVAQLQTEIYEVQRAVNEERLAEIRARRPEISVTHLSEEEREPFRQRALEVREAFVAEAGPRAGRLVETLERAVERARRRIESAGGDE